jgi:hypothetical protein
MFNEKRPSLLRVVQIDYWTFVAAVSTIILWIFFLYDALIAKNDSQTYLYWIVPFTVFCVIVVAWRYASILNIYGIGQEAKAVVNGAGFFRDRGYISFIYTYQGQKYQVRSAVLRTRRTTRYQVGDEIDVVVSRDNPKKAIIRDLYV